jgi:hypothetical protein
MDNASLFGLFIVEREPYVAKHFLGLFQVWLQDAGGFAFVGLSLYMWYSLRMSSAQAKSAKDRAGISGLMLGMMSLSTLLYAAYIAMVLSGRGAPPPTLAEIIRYQDPNAFVKYEPPVFSTALQSLTLMLAGVCALIGVGEPFVRNVMRLSIRRISAIAKLCVLEVIRTRVFLVFLLFLIPMMFPVTWFLYTSYKPEDELRLAVGISMDLVQFLVLLLAALIGSFPIPNDIKNQNIYTILTKPVERLEVLLGRYLGYLSVLTLGIFIMVGLSALYLNASGVNPKAAKETMKARVPVYGKLGFDARVKTADNANGLNVGREFDYRRYIPGDPSTSQRAVWNYSSLPSYTGGPQKNIPCEFSFDIFRLTKGNENRGVDITVRITTWKCPQKPPMEAKAPWSWAEEVAVGQKSKQQQYQDDYEAKRKELNKAAGRQDNDSYDPLLNATPNKDPKKNAAWEAINELAKKYGYYEYTGKEVYDYHPDSIPVPAGLFENARDGSPAKGADGKPLPVLTVYVHCTSPGQMLGMADADLYFLETEQTFTGNYLKSAIGYWCRMAILLGICVCISTYLSGVISLITGVIVFVIGFAAEHLEDMASGKSFVGGPARAITQILKAEQPTAQMDPGSTSTTVTGFLDYLVAWGFRRIQNIVPDVHAFGWADYVKEGFNIPLESLLMNLLMTFAYLLPWLILGFYSLRSREIAE